MAVGLAAVWSQGKQWGHGTWRTPVDHLCSFPSPVTGDHMRPLKMRARVHGQFLAESRCKSGCFNQHPLDMLVPLLGHIGRNPSAVQWQVEGG